jgi:serine/threonine-protein kinase RsbW
MKSESEVVVMDKKLIIESKIENISLVEKAIDDCCAELKISSEMYGNILISVIEVVTNAIIHGNKLDKTKKVLIGISCSDDKYMTFTIEDQGNGFNFDIVPDPTLPENLEKPHGRGIFLMKNLADKVIFENKGSKTILIFKIKVAK